MTSPRLFSNEWRPLKSLCLEGFQAGLSWMPLLNKREALRRALTHFAAER